MRRENREWVLSWKVLLKILLQPSFQARGIQAAAERKKLEKKTLCFSRAFELEHHDVFYIMMHKKIMILCDATSIMM